MRKIKKMFPIYKLAEYIPYLLLALMASHGSLGGDEGSIFAMTQIYLQENKISIIDFLKTYHEFNAILQNHLFWFLLMLAERYILDFSIDLFALHISSHQYALLISYPLSFLSLLSIYISFKICRLMSTSSVSIQLSIFFIFFGSSVIGLLTGGFIECFILFAISLRMYVELMHIKNNAWISILLLVVTDFLIICAKTYSVILICFFLCCNFKNFKVKNKIIYIATFCLLNFIWIYVTRFIIPIGNQSQLWISLISSNTNINSWIQNMLAALFSFGFGIFWITPFFTCLLFSTNIQLQRIFYMKFLVILTLQSYFCIYPFWHGAQGLAGQRYILPFLVIFLPEVSLLIEDAVKKRSCFLYSIPLCIALFIPTVDYRNTLSDIYSQQNLVEIPKNELFDLNFPFYDLSFQPAIFAWHIEYSILFDKKFILAAISRKMVLQPTQILPMTSLSRIIYLSNAELLNRKDLIEVKSEIPNWLRFPMKILRILLIIIFFFYLLKIIHGLNYTNDRDR